MADRSLLMMSWFYALLMAPIVVYSAEETNTELFALDLPVQSHSPSFPVAPADAPASTSFAAGSPDSYEPRVISDVVSRNCVEELELEGAFSSECVVAVEANESAHPHHPPPPHPSSPSHRDIPLEFHFHSPDGVSLTSTIITAHVRLDSPLISSPPLLAAAVCDGLVVSSSLALAIEEKWCEQELIPKLELGAEGIQAVVLSRVPIAHYREGKETNGRFLEVIVGPPSPPPAASQQDGAVEERREELEWKTTTPALRAKSDSDPVATGSFRVSYVHDKDPSSELPQDDSHTSSQPDGDSQPPVSLPQHLSFFDTLDEWASSLRVVSPRSTLSGFTHPNIYLRGPGLASPKGRGIWARSKIESLTMIELSPALLVPSLSTRVSDGRDYDDTPKYNVLLDYVYPIGGGLADKFSLLPFGWGALYNHCIGAEVNISWEIVRMSSEEVTMSNRYTSFAIRFVTIKRVEEGEELCWDYGPAYWQPSVGLYRAPVITRDNSI